MSFQFYKFCGGRRRIPLLINKEEHTKDDMDQFSDLVGFRG